LSEISSPARCIEEIMVGKSIKQQEAAEGDKSVSAANKAIPIYAKLKSQAEHSFLFLIDGYEELKLMENLYKLNQLAAWEESM